MRTPDLIPWQDVPCCKCGKPSAGVVAGPEGACHPSALVLCREHYRGTLKGPKRRTKNSRSRT